VRGDICDADRVSQLLADDHIDAIVHFAAESHVDRSILGPLPFVQTNVVGTTVLLEAARKAQVQRFLHVSTDEVYGTLGPTDPPFYRGDAAGSTIAVCRQQSRVGSFGTSVCAYLRTAGGGDALLEQLRTVSVSRKAAAADDSVGARGSAAAGVRRRATGARLDLRRRSLPRNRCALRRGRPGAVYNFGGRAERTNLAMVQAILELVGKPRSLIRFVADRPGHDRRYAVECSRAEHELDWHARWRLDDGLRETVRWYREHPSWCQSVQSGEYRTFYDRNYTTRLAASTEVEQCG
jgi:dTDP-glucose 4,6-dehydratase